MLVWDPPRWWTAKRVPNNVIEDETSTMRKAVLSLKKPRSTVVCQIEQKELQLVYKKVYACKICHHVDWGHWVRNNRSIHLSELFESAEKEGCAGCLVLCGDIMGSPTSTGEDVFGYISSGSITLRGRYMTAELKKSSFWLRTINPECRHRRINFLVNTDDDHIQETMVQFSPDFDSEDISTSRSYSEPLELNTEVNFFAMAETYNSISSDFRSHFPRAPITQRWTFV
jgi:hypothetical protein